MKITIEVQPKVVDALRRRALEIVGGFGSEAARLRRGIAIIAEVAAESRADEELWRSQPLVSQCAWCHRFKGVMRWTLSFNSTELRIAQCAKRVSHGICPDCLRQQQEKESAPRIAEIVAEAECLAIRADASASGRVEAGLTSSSLPVVSAELHEGVLSARRSDACAAADAVPAGV